MTDTESNVTTKMGGLYSLAAPIGTGQHILTDEEQREYYKKILNTQLASSKELQDLSLKELKDAIRKAKSTQTWILALNIIMFFFGIVLISVAVYAGYSNMSPMYSVLFGGIGFAELVASFFIGAMQRSQKSISDLVQVEITFLNFFEQVTLWEQYAAIRTDKGGYSERECCRSSEKDSGINCSNTQLNSEIC